MYSVSLGDKTSELSLTNNSNSNSDHVELLLKSMSSHAFKVLLELVTETLVQVDQPGALHELVLVVSRSGYGSGGIVPDLKDYGEH